MPRPKRADDPSMPAPRSPHVSSPRPHVHSLPPELLSSIFLLLHSSAPPSTPPSPRQLSQVCHAWRSVALSEPLLWARSLNLCEGPKWTVEVLRRSGECPLDVVGSYSSSSSSSRTGHASSRAGGRGGVLGAVLKELERIRRLHLTIEKKDDWRIVVDTLTRSRAPALESLAVKSSIRRIATSGVGGPLGIAVGGTTSGGNEEVPMRLPDALFRGSTGVLKTLSLAMVALGSGVGGGAASMPWLAGLTTLQVTDLEEPYLMSVWEWLGIVRQTPLLEKLVLRSVFANEVEPDSPEDAGRVVLKRLRSIELRGTMMECCEFLKRLVVPGECSIHMDAKRANNAHAANVLGEFFKERKERAENMEGILKTPDEAIREAKRRRSLLVHPSTHELHIKVDEMVGEERCIEAVEGQPGGREEEGSCHVNLLLSFGYPNQSEERHQLVMDIFDTLTRTLQTVYEDKGGFGSLNLSLFGLRDGIKYWETGLVQFFSRLDRVEHLQEVSGYTASVVFPLLVRPPQQQQYRPASLVVGLSSSPSERYRQSVLLPSLQRVTLAFVEFSTNVDDEFEGCCDVSAVPDFVRRRLGLGLEVGGISVVRQRMLRLRFECCSGPQWILDDLKQLGLEYSLGWACDFEDT